MKAAGRLARRRWRSGWPPRHWRVARCGAAGSLGAGSAAAGGPGAGGAAGARGPRGGRAAGRPCAGGGARGRTSAAGIGRGPVGCGTVAPGLPGTAAAAVSLLRMRAWSGCHLVALLPSASIHVPVHLSICIYISVHIAIYISVHIATTSPPTQTSPPCQSQLLLAMMAPAAIPDQRSSVVHTVRPHRPAGDNKRRRIGRYIHHLRIGRLNHDDFLGARSRPAALRS